MRRSLFLYVCGCEFVVFCYFFFFKQKTAYEMRISDWSSDVCSSDLVRRGCESNAAGCSLNNAAVELREAQHPAIELVRAHKADVRRRFALLAGAAGAADAEALGDALLLLLEGSAASLLTFHCTDATVHGLQAAVRVLLDAPLPTPTPDASSSKPAPP